MSVHQTTFVECVPCLRSRRTECQSVRFQFWAESPTSYTDSSCHRGPRWVTVENKNSTFDENNVVFSELHPQAHELQLQQVSYAFKPVYSLFRKRLKLIKSKYRLLNKPLGLTSFCIQLKCQQKRHPDTTEDFRPLVLVKIRIAEGGIRKQNEVCINISIWW